MAWPTKKLGELTDICRGSSPRPICDTKYFDGGTVPWVKIADATKSGKFLYETKEHVNDYGASFSRRLPPGTILVAASGTLGYTQILGVEGCAHDGWLILQNLRDLDRDFAYYALKTLEQHFFNSGSGAAIQNINTDILRQAEIPHPPLPVQRRIAGILSAYDGLIENSQRRIKILEAMARGLYREWFVHFRFPGHEKHPRVASPLGDIPQGWEVKTVADSFEISGGGTPSRKEEKYWDGGTIQWFSPSDLTGAGTMFMDDSSDHITELGLAESSARLFPARSVMLTSRATIGAIAINTHQACTNQGFITCLPNERIPLYFLFHWLTENVPTFQRMASGATFKEISRGVFKTIEFLQPPTKLVRRFEDAAAPMAEQALALQRQIQNLRRTRDLLLPRLLSGKVELS